MNMKRWLITGLIGLSLPVSGQSLFQPVEISDAELAQLRGRFVLPDRIIHFGVTMSTFWQNSAGQTIGARASLQVSGNAQPSLYVTPIEQVGNGSQVSAGNGQIIGGAGLNSVQGIVQSVRTAGDFNEGQNSMTISISQGAAQASAQGQPWTGPSQFANEAGTVQIRSHAGGLQIALQANNGQGFAQQTIGGGQVVQQSGIGGSLNNVRNLAELTVSMRDNPRSLNATLCAWEQLRSLYPAGY